MVAAGMQSKEIAAATGRAAKTIDKHIENACRKLSVGTRRQAARLYSESLLRSDSVEAPFPLSLLADLDLAESRKGGVHAANRRTSTDNQLGGARGDIRRSGGEQGTAGRGGEVASNDKAASGPSFTARLDARDLLHRARSPLRERSLTEGADDGVGEKIKRMMMIPVIAALVISVIAAILGGGVQLQLAIQTIDRMLSGR